MTQAVSGGDFRFLELVAPVQVQEAVPTLSAMAASGTVVNSLIVEPLVPSCSKVSEGAFTTSGASNFDLLSWDSYYRGMVKSLLFKAPASMMSKTYEHQLS